ncbi:capsid cement protein [Rhizobium mayense]|uniref:DUF2190 family protein n=1 Tax=Rhizobium mayense TaxID=1312184 RepID=A0ABT7K1F0_9HYPH|nr:hypothetical protein [Rhizobium mayense]MDL2401258.1 hypothetical protein [Rhizobium mayense]
MTASNDLYYDRRRGDSYGFPVLAGVKIFGRAAVGVTAAGLAVPAGNVNAVALLGLAKERVDNTNGANGDVYVDVDKGIFNIPLAGATPADVHKPVYATADDTFTLTASTNLQIGTLDAIDAAGAWMKTL